MAPVGSDAAAAARALELAYRYLSRRERTVHELRSHLVSRDLEPAAVDAAIAELGETGYLDDARYARLFVEDKRTLERWGSGRIRNALLSRGIERDLVDAALSEETRLEFEADDHETETELSRAVSVLRQRFPHPPRERRERQRALGVLIRRGYELELAMDALAAYARDEA